MSTIIFSSSAFSGIQSTPAEDSKAEKAYRLLNKIVKEYPQSSVCFNIAEVKRLLGDDLSNIRFEYCRNNALLHDHTTCVTKTASSDLKLKRIWSEFLETAHGIEVCYPDGEQLMKLDFSPEIAYLDSAELPGVAIVPLDFKQMSQEDKDTIWEIQNEAFGAYELPPREGFEQWYQNASHTLLTARNEVTDSIDGFLLFGRRNDSLIDVYIVARRANAAKRGIGTQLMNAFTTHYVSSGIDVELCVRESHLTAQELYRKFGFEDNGYGIPERACPPERDLKMMRKAQKVF